MRVVFSAQAKASLRSIALFIARDDKQRAQSFVRTLRQKAFDLAHNPLAFARVPRFERQAIRRRVYREYSISYQVKANVV